jgi:hypothetical protein
MKSQKLFSFILILTLIVTSFLLSGNSNADPLDHWHWRNPLPQGNHLSAMAYGNGAFVAVGDSGTTLTSPDGATWTARSSGTTNGLLGIAYGNGAFVAIGDSGVILSSPDGATWTQRSFSNDYGLASVAYGNGIFVAVGESGSIGPGPTGGKLFGTILTSPDGITWTARSLGTATYPLCGIAYGNGIFIAVGNPPPAVFNPLSSEQAVTSSGLDAIILTSSDGITWTPQSSAGASFLSEVAYGNGIFVAVGNTILTSPHGITWTPQSSGSDNSLSGITYGNGIFVAGGDLGAILTSPNGVTWITRSSGITDNLSGVAYGDGILVAVGGSNIIGPFGSILTSLDGETWTIRSSGSTNNLFGIAYGNSTFVAVGYTGVPSGNPSCPIGECATILTSADGVT